MPVEAEEITALALVFGVHLVGALMLVWALLDPEQRARWRNPPRPPRGGGDDDPVPPQPPGPSGARAPADPPPGLPLPATAPSSVRLREPVRVADGYPRPARRPAHEPQPQRAPVPGRQRQRR
jgi:hypothetical protein